MEGLALLALIVSGIAVWRSFSGVGEVTRLRGEVRHVHDAVIALANAVRRAEVRLAAIDGGGSLAGETADEPAAAPEPTTTVEEPVAPRAPTPLSGLGAAAAPPLDLTKQRDGIGAEGTRPEPRPLPEPRPPTVIGGPPPLSEAPETAASEAQAETDAEPAMAARTATATTRTGTVDATIPPEPPKETIPLDRLIAERWLVWAGGLALILGICFFIVYAIEAGLIGPGLLVLAGLAAGGAMVYTGSTMAGVDSVRQVLKREEALPSQVAPAITAAGIVTLYGCVFAAQPAIGLGPALTFLGLAAVSGLALALAIHQGAALAALGMLGAYLVPAMVAADDPNPGLLMAYLAVTHAVGIGVAWWRGWSWLGWFVLAAAFLWNGATMDLIDDGGPTPKAAFGVLQAIVLTAFLIPHVLDWRMRGEAGTVARNLSLLQAWVATLVFAFFAFVAMIELEEWPVTGVIGFGAALAGTLATGRRAQTLDLMPIVPIMFALVAVAVPDFEPAARLIWAATFAVLLGFIGFLGLGSSERPFRWGLYAGAGPIAVLGALYAGFLSAGTAVPWPLVAAGVTAIVAAMAWARAGQVEVPSHDRGVGGLVLSIIAGISLTASMLASQAFLTVALALQVPLVAIAYGWIPIRELRASALVLTALVVARLTINPDLVTYDPGPIPGIGWVAYGYGVPILAFLGGASLFRSSGDLRLVDSLRGAAVFLAVVMANVSIRMLIAGDVGAPEVSYAEGGLHIIAWLGGSLVLFEIDQRNAPSEEAWPVLGLAWRGLLALGSIALLLAVLANPLTRPQPVGELMIFNALITVYAVPAALLIAIGQRLSGTRGVAELGSWLSGAGFLVGFLWLNLETRHFHQGSVLAGGGVSDAELYSYSVVWTVVAAGLVVVGLLVRNARAARMPGLALFALVGAKVFLVDMSGLEGLFRALSFLGLGATLLAVGWAYGRLRESDSPAAKVEAPPARN